MNTQETITTVRYWEELYQVMLGNKKLYERRLRDIKLYGKPLNPKENDKHSNWVIWECQMTALENLISQ